LLLKRKGPFALTMDYIAVLGLTTKPHWDIPFNQERIDHRREAAGNISEKSLQEQPSTDPNGVKSCHYTALVNSTLSAAETPGFVDRVFIRFCSENRCCTLALLV
jgi:hypothetical protein